jgi:hypothetical protein
MKSTTRTYIWSIFVALCVLNSTNAISAQTPELWSISEGQTLTFESSCTTKDYSSGRTEKGSAKIMFVIEKIDRSQITYDYDMQLGRSNKGLCLSVRQIWNDYVNTNSIYGPATNALWIHYVYDSAYFLDIVRIWQTEIELWQNISKDYSQLYGGDKTALTFTISNTSYEIRLTWITREGKSNEYNKKVIFSSEGILRYYREVHDTGGKDMVKIEVQSPDYLDPTVIVGLVLGGVFVFLGILYYIHWKKKHAPKTMNVKTAKKSTQKSQMKKRK